MHNQGFQQKNSCYRNIRLQILEPQHLVLTVCSLDKRREWEPPLFAAYIPAQRDSTGKFNFNNSVSIPALVTPYNFPLWNSSNYKFSHTDQLLLCAKPIASCCRSAETVDRQESIKSIIVSVSIKIFSSSSLFWSNYVPHPLTEKFTP